MDFYLHVHATVSHEGDALAKFNDAINKFLATKFLENNFDWRLVAAVQVEQQQFPGEPLLRPLVAPQEDEYTFINIWRLPDNNSVAQIPDIMLRLSELPEYVQLDNAVVDESQEVVYRVNQALDPETLQPCTDEAVLSSALKQRKKIAFVRHYVDRSKLAEYVVNFAAMAPKWAREQRFLYAGTYQNITGLLNEFWDVWGVDDGEDLNSFRHKFQSLIGKENGDVVALYKESIDYDKKDPRIEYSQRDVPSIDDGLLIATPAFYWR